MRLVLNVVVVSGLLWLLAARHLTCMCWQASKQVRGVLPYILSARGSSAGLTPKLNLDDRVGATDPAGPRAMGRTLMVDRVIHLRWLC